MESARLQQRETSNEADAGRTEQPRSTFATGSRVPLTFNDARSPVLQLRRSVFLHILTKLTINEPGDEYEQEADRVAEQVMRMPDPAIRLQRKCGCGGTSGACECDNQSLKTQRKAAVNTATENAPPAVVHDVLRMPGQPLDQSTRMFFESRFAHDFSHVRVHTDARAAEAARAVNALAYTVGNNIVFGAGRYEPAHTSGRRLISHELAHVVQNANGSGGSLIKRYESFEHQDFGDTYLQNLIPFLETDEGERWARSAGIDRRDLIRRIRSDRPFVVLRTERNPATGVEEPVQLSSAEIISLMGDFFGSPGELARAPASEIRRILGVIREERLGTISTAQAISRYEEITGGRFLRLATLNETHFAILNKREWRRLHEEAITLSRSARGEHAEEQFQRALLFEASASHFLTDAFAAGHLFPRREVFNAITLHLHANPVTAANPGMQTYIWAIGMSGRMPDLVLKNVHDRMNREGFWVTNERGMRWRTFGDNYLRLATETQRIGALAVFLSRQQIVNVRGSETATADPAEIESLMPNDDTVRRATQQAIDFIPDAAREAENLVYRNRELAPTQFGPVFGAIVQSNLTTIGHPGRERELMNLLDSARRIGNEAPIAPSFTIFSFQ